MKTNLKKKFAESLAAVLPIIIIVSLLCFTVAPVHPGVLLAFLLGSLMLIVGMMLFSLGAESAMEPMGKLLGARVTGSRSLIMIIIVGLIVGMLVTVSEPDLQVLAKQVQTIPSTTLIITVAAGVGLFLVIALLRILFAIPLNLLLIVFYAGIIVLSIFMPESFRALAFDSGGVTTGPMTVPFIMAFGVGVSAIRSDKEAANDSFGLVALSSVGPIIAVMALALVFNTGDASYTPEVLPDIDSSTFLAKMFAAVLPEYIKKIAIAVLPIAGFFFVYNFLFMHLHKKTLQKIGWGLVYTYVGLVLFLTGVSAGFMPAGRYIGQILGGSSYAWLLLPVGMVIGYCIVKAEPAIVVLMQQVEEITDGAIRGRALMLTLSIGTAVSVGLSMLRVLTGLSILWFVIPGYVIALLLSFFTPHIFTAIAFDSGGVASGPMTATFLLPLAVGVSIATGGDIVKDAFGVVAMVALTPLIAIQILGLIYKLEGKATETSHTSVDILEKYDKCDIIDL